MIAGALSHEDRALAACNGATHSSPCSVCTAEAEGRIQQVGSLRKGSGPLGSLHPGRHCPASTPGRPEGAPHR